MSSHSSTLRGIAAMLLACAFFAGMDSLLKVLGQHFPPSQVAALRGLTALPLVCLYIAWRREGAQVFTRGLRWRLHGLRVLLNLGVLWFFVYGLRTMGLAEAYTLGFVAPLLVTLLAAPILGERVLPRHWAAIGVGFVGVVVALRPEQGAFLSIGAVAILAGAACYALSNLLGRLISRTESSASLVFWATAGLAMVGTALAAPSWVPVGLEHAWLLAGLAFTGFAGQLAIAEAFRHGQASAIVPFEYSALLWAVALDWLLWSAVPDAWTLGGGALIIASGLYLARSEAAKPAVAPASDDAARA